MSAYAVPASPSQTAPTDKALQLARREGFIKGAYTAHSDRLCSAREEKSVGMYIWQMDKREPYISAPEKAAVARYPIVSRVPREVDDPEYNVRWRIVKGQIELHTGTRWVPYLHTIPPERGTGTYGTAYPPTIPRCAMWADLLANPFTEVEE